MDQALRAAVLFIALCVEDMGQMLRHHELESSATILALAIIGEHLLLLAIPWPLTLLPPDVKAWIASTMMILSSIIAGITTNHVGLVAGVDTVVFLAYFTVPTLYRMWVLWTMVAIAVLAGLWNMIMTLRNLAGRTLVVSGEALLTNHGGHIRIPLD